MCFKNWLVGLFAIIMVCGCAKRGTADNLPIVVQVKANGDCISNLSGQVKSFVDGASSPNDITAFWACMSASINEFENVTAGDGDNGDTYSADALREFIEHYFYKSRHISDPVLAGIMQIKRVIIGGSEANVTRAELKDLDALFAQLRAVTLSLQPSVRIIFRKDTHASDAQIRKASVDLQLALTQLGTWLNNKNQSYDFQSITTTVNNIANWAQDGGKDSSMMHSLRQAALVLPSAKSILVGGDTKAIDGQDWMSICNAISRGLSLYLAGANGFDDNLDAALIRNIIPEMAQPALGVFALSAQNHSSSTITLQEFKNLFTQLAQTDWLPSEINASGLTALWTWLLKRPLGDGVTQPTGLSVSQIGILQSQLNDWIALLTSSPQDPSALVTNFNAMLASSQAITWDAQGRMIYPDQFPTGWNDDSRRHMIWPYVILKWLIGSYAPAGSATLGDDQVTTAAQEVLPLLQNFGWLKATKVTIGKRILREADLFTLASNGDGQLDINEATRYLAFVVSSFRSAQVWLDTAQAQCGGTQVDCVRALPLQNTNILAPMPRLQNVMKTWASGQFVAYLEHSEQTVLGALETGNYTTGDLLQAWQLIGYIEVFMELYDANHDDHIDLNEATAAFKVYGPTLGKLLSGAGLQPEEVLAFFTFMMKYGDTPFTMFGGQVAFNYWRWHTDTWAVSADRDLLMSILNQLSKL